MKRKTIIILLVVGFGLFFLWTGYLWKWFSCGIAGSYPCVETWTLNAPENEVIDIIKEIKREHPELQPPLDTGLTYGRSKNWDSTELVEPVDWSTMQPQYSYWYYITFYYADTKENVYTWTRPADDPSFTTLALDALATHIDSLTPINEMKMDRKQINRDYGYFANKGEITKFEHRILDLIRQKIDERK
ncbi:MAG: hypothetical protein K0Q95_241 [Bacteroidota bacterium]|jgi:hypothetical protein|nr:hypothetical protein [Bacteroidota bacterium]